MPSPDTKHDPGPAVGPAYAVGIDFGTTNSSVARIVNGHVELLTLSTPTIKPSPSSRSLLYLEKAPKGILSSTGPHAIERYLSAHREGDRPGRLIQSLKSYLPSRSLTGTEVFGRHYTLEDLISRILLDLRQAAEHQFNHPITRATVGRPVRFVGAETEEDETFALTRLRAAFTRAGFTHIDFEYEPLGAAYSYQSTLTHPETILIGDFGGGTSDFSILTLGPLHSSQERQVLGTAGLPFAGDAFDARIIRNLVSPALGSNSFALGLNKTLPAVPAWIYANLERWHYLSFLRTRNVLEILTSAQKRAIEPEKIQALLALVEEDLGYQLHQAVQRTKVALSHEEEAPFNFSGPDAGTMDLRTTVHRADFERWITPELLQIAETVDTLLETAKLPPQKIDRVFLTGGTSLVPAVRSIFETRFPTRVTAGDEFTSVAQGLALKAAETTS
ncbi:Hsp70 family protein [Granulicella tundricola]|uniref:Molecular chaperone n=1 Tax=Granulicella tundricola (strain ATCC BAA-1859 / DSM 23138 / MP5ACTX9) TaxID=1198114 RepID=E8X340_GRATM|nr:Hsp70 family protein [Granulicella tundricola]ADW69264.1 molecular chaperone [Granulicella tundricola MP5ACTX9]